MHIHIHTYIHNTGLVFSIFGISTKKQGGVTSQRAKSKFDNCSFTHIVNGHLLVQKIWFKYFPVLRL